jgi:hypothetical protein
MLRTELNGMIREWIRAQRLMTAAGSAEQDRRLGGWGDRERLGTAEFKRRAGRYVLQITVRSTSPHLNDPAFVATMRDKFGPCWEPAGFEYPMGQRGVAEADLPAWLAAHAWIDGQLVAR